MWLSRSLLCSLIIAILCFAYVYQHVEIVKQGYQLNDNMNSLSILVDQNSRLMYDLSRLESPRNLLSKIDTGGFNFGTKREEMSDTYLLGKPEIEEVYAPERLSDKIFDMFTLHAAADARRKN
ncbi:MAG: hypothetical protein HQL28_06390 [Candidatus Omnitrophica bacterium]|nr:hypothetical protein [Candidatus Omnitrophota bacterium]